MTKIRPLLLLRPTLQSIKNRWRGKIDMRAHAGRDLFLGMFSLLVMVAVFVFTRWAILEADKNPTLAMLHPSMLLGLVFAMLFAMLVISSVLVAMGSFYLSQDLELILPSPVKWSQIFIGKFLYVYLFSSWMPFLFAYPMLLAFGVVNAANWVFFVAAPALMLPLFAIAAGLGVVLASLIITLIPMSRVREAVIVFVIAGIALVYLLLDGLGIEWDSLRSAQEIMRLMTLITAPSATWLPSNWLGISLGEMLKPKQEPGLSYALLLTYSSLACVALAYLFSGLVHASAYSNILRRRANSSYLRRRAGRVLRRAPLILQQEFRALLGKEVRVILRDIGQVVQIFMLVAISFAYLYYMRLFSAVDAFPEAIRPWWKNFLFIGNITMGAFVITALCTRFVVPSISLEGKSFWIVQTSPLNLKELVRIKFLAWLTPTAFISLIFFVSGAVAIGADLQIILLCALASLIMSYGIVGLAIGFGAYFAYFDWEHSSQLAGSVGSLLFMLAATGLIFLNMIPAWVVLTYGSYLSRSDNTTLLSINLLALLLAALTLNIYAGRIVMKGGVESLSKRLS